jgi:hypothetical protein
LNAEEMYRFHADIIQTFHKYPMQLNGLVANLIIYRSNSSMMLDDPGTIQRTYQDAKYYLQACGSQVLIREEWRSLASLDRMIEILEKMRCIFQRDIIHHQVSISPTFYERQFYKFPFPQKNQT